MSTNTPIPLIQPPGTVDAMRYLKMVPASIRLVWQINRKVGIGWNDTVGDTANWPVNLAPLPATPSDWGYGYQMHALDDSLVGQDIITRGAVTLLGRQPDQDGVLLFCTNTYEKGVIADQELFDNYMDCPRWLPYGHSIINNDCDTTYKNFRFTPTAVESGHCQSQVIWFVPPVPGATANQPPPYIVRW